MDDITPTGMPKETNGYAVASAVLGTLGACFLGIPLGIIALVQTHRSGQRGRGVAVIGLVMSCVWIVLIVLVGTRGGAGSAKRDDLNVVTRGGTLSLRQLRAGDCIKGLGGASVVGPRVLVVPCTEPHTDEVFALFALPAGDYPDDDALAHMSGDRCNLELDQLKQVNPHVFSDTSITLSSIVPRDDDWRRGDREVACLITTEDRRTGSIMQAPA